MKYPGFVLFLVFLLISCNDVKEKVSPASDANRKNIANLLNTIRSVKKPNVDSTMIATAEMASRNEPPEYKAMVSIASGSFYHNKSSYELATKHYERALWQLKKSTADTLRAFAYTGIGNCYKNTGEYPKALDNLYKALKIFENRKDILGVSRVNAFIGEVHMQKNDFTAAKENLLTAMKLLDNNKGQAGWLSAAHTLANVYGMSGDYKNALKIDEEGIRISDSVNSPAMKSTFLDNKANCYMFSNQLDSAQYYFEECLKIDIAGGNKKQIADTYSNLGSLASFKGDFNKAEALTLKSIEIQKSLNTKFNIAKSYQILSEIYERKGDNKKALEAHRQFYDVYKKSVNEKKEASVAEFKILHETDRKEKELAENKVQLLQKSAEAKQWNNAVIVLSLLVFFLILISFLINRQQKLKNRQLAQEHELKTAISKIETQNELQNQRLRISRDLHDNIGAQLTFIISSVENLKYVFDIKNTKLDNKLDNISIFTRETIVELRDTIWAMNHSEITFEDLRARILNFIEKAKEAKEDIGFRFTIDEKLFTIKLTSIQGMNMCRTIQEAVNNAFKYADASEIDIDIQSVPNGINITITDNGSGFDTATVEKGNGLWNMEKRIGDIGGEISIDSQPGKGTTINISLPENLKGKKS